MSNFTKGEWLVEQCDLPTTESEYFNINAVSGGCIAETYNEHDASLISAAPDMYHMIKSLSDELELAINEINTMRDIHHTDNLTPADHWDQESLHLAQVLLAKARGEIK